MSAIVSPIFTVFNNGQVASGAKVNTYLTGTTTPLTTYSDAGLTTPNANPIIADVNGQVSIYIPTTAALRLDLYTSADAFIKSVDPVYPGATATGGASGTEATIPSAATTDLGAAGVNIIKVTGTTGITSFGSSASTANPIYYVRFTGALTITHSANIVCPGGSNITTANGSALIAEYLGSGVWQVLFLQSASGGSYLQVSNNLSDLANKGTARANLAYSLKAQPLTASGNFAALTTEAKFTVIGGGGGGGGGSGAGTAAGGGGAGATAIYYATGLTVGNNYAVTIGAGGSGSSSGTGSNGGNSSVVIGATTITAGGGLGGEGNSTACLGGAGGTATNGTINIPGGDGQSSANPAAGNLGGHGGASHWGGGGKGAISGTATNGGAQGSGGGGGANSSAIGGNGANGIVLVEWVL